MTKEEEWNLLAKIHQGEQVLLIDAWKIPDVLTHCTKKKNSKSRIRIGVVENLIQEMAQQEHPKATVLFMEHQRLEELRKSIVQSTAIVDDALYELYVNAIKLHKRLLFSANF